MSRGWGKERRPVFRLPVTPDDVVRHALAAYYRAVGEATAPIGDPYPADWSDPEQFLNTLCDFMQLRMRCESFEQGHQVNAEPERLALWLSRPMHRDQHIQDVDPGLWAEMQASAAGASMAHGCAALSSAVGSAPVTVAEGAGAVPGDPLFLCPSGQELPCMDQINDAQTLEGAGNLCLSNFA